MPLFRRLLTRSWSDRTKGLGALCAAAFWWLLQWAGDKILGDAAFGWLRDVVSPFAQYAWVTLLWTYGVPLGLVGLGAYFYWRTGKQSPHEGDSISVLEPAQSTSNTRTPTSKPETTRSTAPASYGSATSDRPAARAVVPAPDAADQPAAREGPDAVLPGWRKLYRLTMDGSKVHLAFLPDTKEQQADTILLIIYGWKLIGGSEQIRQSTVHNEYRRVIEEAPNARYLDKIRGFSSVNLMLADIDYGAQAVNEGYTDRINLSKGGDYRLTRYGLDRARTLALDLIARA